jgi:hypothetical protein
MVELSRASMQCTNESCLLWISASIGKAPTNNKKTAQVASKLTWKLPVKRAIQLYWTEFLLKEMQGKSTLHFMDQITLKIGSTHPIWTSLSSTVSNLR